MAQAFFAWDRTVLLWINAHHAPWSDAVLLPVSLLGEAGALWFAVALALLIFGRREHKVTGLALLLTIVLVDRLVSAPLGQMFYRDRPYAAVEGVRQLGVRWGGTSFPSGHAHSVWIAAIILSSRWPVLTVPLIGFAALTCYSRPYLGMHYPLDVLAGSALGIAGGVASLAIQRLWREKSKVAPA